MALTLPTASRNAACNAVVDLIDAGAGDGYIEIGTASMAATLVSNNFSDPAFGDAATGVATAAAIDDGTATGTGTAAEARIRDSDANDIITGLTVGTGSEDVVLNTTSITTGDTVAYSAGTITMPAS